AHIVGGEPLTQRGGRGGPVTGAPLARGGGLLDRPRRATVCSRRRRRRARTRSRPRARPRLRGPARRRDPVFLVGSGLRPRPCARAASRPCHSSTSAVRVPAVRLHRSLLWSYRCRGASKTPDRVRRGWCAVGGTRMVAMRGDGDGWAIGPDGLRHWGKYGAAGLLLRAPLAGGGSAVLLQHRAPWSHQGGTWALPGGAKDSHESSVRAAVREAEEEAGIAHTEITVRAERVTAAVPSGWTYTTVVADAPATLATSANRESLELAWVPEDE